MEFSAQQIAALLGGKITGDANRKVSDIASIENAREGQLTFLCDQKYIAHLPSTHASVVLMTESIAFDGETNATIIRVENARAAIARKGKIGNIIVTTIFVVAILVTFYFCLK